MWVWSIALTRPTLVVTESPDVVVESPDVVIELPDVVVESPDVVVESHGTRKGCHYKSSEPLTYDENTLPSHGTRKGCHYISAYSGAATARPRSPPFLPILE
jgi:hypothetical protein